jgi:hypothetical protein
MAYRGLGGADSCLPDRSKVLLPPSKCPDIWMPSNSDNCISRDYALFHCEVQLY